MRYRAFISYSHADEAFAAALHEKLERYRVPKRIVAARELDDDRLGVIFRDRDELASSSSLTDTIRAALAESESLIVVCSPAAAGSEWVNAEIETFRDLRPDGQILPLVPGSVPDGSLMALFPPALRTGDEPLAADARESGDGPSRAFLKLVASLIGVRFDELLRREANRRRKRITGFAAGTVVLLSTAALLIGQAWLAEREAAAQRAQATALISYLVEDLTERLTEYEKVGELEQGLSQALNYFGALTADELDDDMLYKYRTVLIGVGSVRIRQGRLEEALATFQRAVELSEESIRRAEKDASEWYELAQVTYYVGEAYWELQDIPAAAREIERALDYARQAAALAPDNATYRLEVVFGLNNMGAVNTRLKRYHDAIAALNAALAENEAMRSAFPELEEDLLEQEVESVSWLAEIVPTLGDYEQGFVWHQREIELREALHERTGNVHHLARLSDALGYYARTLSAVGRTAEAAAVLERKVAISEALSREDPDNVFWWTRGHLGRALLAVERFHDGDMVAAVNLLDQAEAGLTSLIAEGLNQELAEMHIAYVQSNRAYFVMRTAPAQARAHIEAALGVLEGKLATDAPSPVLFDYYLRAVILDSAIRHAAGAEPDLDRLERGLDLMGQRGEPGQSVQDAAVLGLLQLARGDASADTTRQALLRKGYRSEFYRNMWESLTG